MGKSCNTLLLAAGMSGKRGAFSLEESHTLLRVSSMLGTRETHHLLFS
jgi:hypothetical protein